MIRLVLVVVAVTLGGVVALADEKKDKAEKVKLPSDLDEILKLVNKERAKAKLPELTLDPTLCKVAQSYSELMAQKEKLDPRLDGQKPGERLAAAGYKWQTIGQNIASGGGKDQPAPKAADLVANWMAQEQCKVAIVNGKHVHTGLGVARSKNGDYYFTQLFASPSK